MGVRGGTGRRQARERPGVAECDSEGLDLDDFDVNVTIGRRIQEGKERRLSDKLSLRGGESLK